MARQAGRNNRRPDLSSSLPAGSQTDESAGLILPRADTKRRVRAAELMSPEEFQAALRHGQVHEATGHYTDAEQKAETPLARGEAAGYSPDDVVAFYAARRGGDWRLGAYDLVKDAYAEKRPIRASLWDAVVVRAPRGYVREGEVYRPRGIPPAGFVARRTAVIPVWAKAIRLAANSIDGWPPVPDGVYSVEQFLLADDDLVDFKTH